MRIVKSIFMVIGVAFVVVVALSFIANHAGMITKRKLLRSPWNFIIGGKWNKYDNGIINSYTRATAVNFSNRSNFDVADISGEITYYATSGAEMAVVPFQASGELDAHQTVQLPVRAGEISGSATQARIRVEHVKILESE